MKLLYDQNISFRIVKKLNLLFPNSKQVRELKLENATDKEIWEFAKKNDFVIVTFDADFADIANINSCPPKIIWRRIGNMTTKNISYVLEKHAEIINDFVYKDEYKEIACIEIE